MTSGLRKAHQVIWIVLAIVVPVIMVFAIKDVNTTAFAKAQTPQAIATDKALQIAENEIIKAAVFESRLELILKTTLKNPSSIVFEMDGNGDTSKILGQLTTAGLYTFEINNLPRGIIISDVLKQVEITKLSFTWD